MCYQTKETKITPRLHKLAKNNDNNMLSSNLDVVLSLDITPSGLQLDKKITQYNNTKNKLDFSFWFQAHIFVGETDLPFLRRGYLACTIQECPQMSRF